MRAPKRIDVRVPSENEFKEILRQFFAEHGFETTDIDAHAVERRADMLVQVDSERTLLELKIKGDDEREAAERRQTLDAGKIYSHSESSLRRNRFSAIVEEAVDQLKSTPVENDFRVLWFHASGRFAEHHAKRFTATIYGRRFLIHTERPIKERWAYYFDNSEFFKHRHFLAAAIVSHEDNCQLCINDHYSAAGVFRTSTFRRLFERGYIDPVEFEASGHAYIVDGPISRDNADDVAAYVTDKYGCGRVMHLDLAMHTAETIAREPTQ